MKKIAVVDDNHLLRDHLVARLQPSYTVVFEAAGAEQFFDWMRDVSPNDYPDLVLMDIEMDEMDGVEAAAIIKSKYPQLRVVMLTVFDQEEKVWNSIVAGADGYILKDETKERLLAGIEDVLAGGAYMSPGIARKAMHLLQQTSPVLPGKEVEVLTRREVEILELLQQGKSYKAIADVLYISPHTAKTHIHNIYEKLQVHNKTEASNKLHQSGRLRR
jgi:DNA-binding NarL/FixJ family response regulator